MSYGFQLVYIQQLKDWNSFDIIPLQGKLGDPGLCLGTQVLCLGCPHGD